MKCPYCGEEMAEGRVNSGRDAAFWEPKTKGAREWMTRRLAQRVQLTQGFFNHGAAWYCPACGKIVIEVVEKTEEGDVWGS